MNRKILTAALCAVLTVSVQAAKEKAAPKESGYFYVYSDKGARNSMSFAPSGWMGDYGDIKINDASTENPADGKTAFKVSYSAQATQGANWAGIYWQHPPNNWGSRPGGYNLNGYKRLTFWARGAKGGEKIAEFKIGGITGEYADSDVQSIGPVELTTDWKKYTIDLASKELSQIAGGFCWAASRDDNPDGFTMYLDEVRYEK